MYASNGSSIDIETCFEICYVRLEINLFSKYVRISVPEWVERIPMGNSSAVNIENFLGFDQLRRGFSSRISI